MSGQLTTWFNNKGCVEFWEIKAIRVITSLGLAKSKADNSDVLLPYAKRSFNRSTNAIFGKVGRIAPEEVSLQLVSKCLPMGLSAIPCLRPIYIPLALWLWDFWWNYLEQQTRTSYQCPSFCNFPLQTDMLGTKSNKLCKKFKRNTSMLRYFNISVS